MKNIVLITFIFCYSIISAQYNYNEKIKSKTVPTYTVSTLDLPNIKEGKKPSNIILLIGDGMGIAHLQSGLTVNNGHLYLEYFKHLGLSKTHSANNYITDSAAGGTALSCGQKTKNGMIAMDPDSVPLETILEIAESVGKSTGLVSTSSITHATPASFIAHQPSRNLYENIALDFLKTDFEVIIGGGLANFNNRKDGRNLVSELVKKGYSVRTDMESIKTSHDSKLAGFTNDKHNPPFDERGDMLPVASNVAVNILKQNKKGFFLMIEGSQIDWGAHANNTDFIVGEMLDFDYTIGEILKFAAKDKHTLVLVTADHETGGMALTGGDYKKGTIDAKYSSKKHSGSMVPVFAWGPGAEQFTGIMDNTDIFTKMKNLIAK